MVRSMIRNFIRNVYLLVAEHNNTSTSLSRTADILREFWANSRTSTVDKSTYDFFQQNRSSCSSSKHDTPFCLQVPGICWAFLYFAVVQSSRPKTSSGAERLFTRYLQAHIWCTISTAFKIYCLSLNTKTLLVAMRRFGSYRSKQSSRFCNLDRRTTIKFPAKTISTTILKT